MIRRAKFGDIPGIVGLMVEVFARSKYRDVGGVDVKEAKRVLMHSIQLDGQMGDGGMLVRVAERDGQLTGFIMGVLQRAYLVGDRLQAQQVYFYQSAGADPVDTINLAIAFGKWAEEANTISAFQTATDIVQKFPLAERLFKNLGYEQSGVIYERMMQ